jgi:hypothetical protein
MLVKKEHVKVVVNTDLITIQESLDLSCYEIYIDFKLFNRLKKIQKLTKSCTHDKIISYIDYLIENEFKEFWNISGQEWTINFKIPIKINN